MYKGICLYECMHMHGRLYVYMYISVYMYMCIFVYNACISFPDDYINSMNVNILIVIVLTMNNDAILSLDCYLSLIYPLPSRPVFGIVPTYCEIFLSKHHHY
jgi:hypothetical protein